MFGTYGWCLRCGVPKQPQNGPLTLQRKSMRPFGVWMPYWEYDPICMSAEVAREVDARFNVELRPVSWHGESPGAAMQIVVPTIGQTWFDHKELSVRVIKSHGDPGARCEACNVWRWLGLSWDELPPLRIDPGLEGADIAASPEWFGTGIEAWRPTVMRRQLAELLQAASPRDFKIVTTTFAARTGVFDE